MLSELDLKQKHEEEMKSFGTYFGDPLWSFVRTIKDFKQSFGVTFGRKSSKGIANDNDYNAVSNVRNSAIEALKKFTDTKHTPMASAEAIKVFNNWKMQNPDSKFDSIYQMTYPERNLLGLLREHTETNASFFDRITDTCINPAQLAIELLRYPGSCWVTYEEDERLTKNGNRTDRPDGWKNAYGGAEIIVYRFGSREI